MNPGLVLHEFTDRGGGYPVYLAWSEGGTSPLEPDLSGAFRVMRGDGTTEDLYISAANVAAASITHYESVGNAGVPKQYTVADTIDVKLEAANPADNIAIALIVGYVVGVDITP